MDNTKKLSISLKSFIISMSIIVGLMIVAYILTFTIPAGLYQRVEGSSVIYTDDLNPYGVYNETTRDFPFWKFILSPFLVLGSDGNITLIAILIFLLVIGGIFSCLSEQNIINYFLKKIVFKYYKKRYVLLVLIPLIFMLLSSFAGCFEEYIPLIPILVSLAISLGWNNLTGLAFSLCAGACGYAAGILNPFGTGVAQQVAGVTTFSGIWLRIVTFVVLYLILVLFLFITCKKYEKKHPFDANSDAVTFERDAKYDKSCLWFLILICVGIAIIISSTFISALQDYTLIVFALCFLIGGVVSCFVSGMKGKKFFKCFGSGCLSLLPTVAMILCASSIKYILTESNTIDTLVKYLIDACKNLSPYLLILFIYLIVLIMEFFVPSGSAKAFLLIPLLMPVANVMNISINLLVLAYIFGDGIANVLYPTNPGLVIALNLADTSFSSYYKYIWKLMIVLFIATIGILLFGLAIGYN